MSLFVLLSIFLLALVNVNAAVGGGRCGESPSYYRYDNLYGENLPRLKMLGGDDATGPDWPWVVRLSVGGFTCTGAIVHNNWILTAGHCGDDIQKNISHSTVGIGAIHNPEQRLIRVKSVHLHPKFNVDSYAHDIALLKLNESLEFDFSIQPICMSRSVQVEENEILAAAGWGFMFGYFKSQFNESESLAPDGDSSTRCVKSPSILRESPVAVRKEEYCALLKADEEPDARDITFICVGGLNNGLMGGDSGGALMARRFGRWFHVGNGHSARLVVAKNRIDVYGQTYYTETSQYCDFIQETTGNEVMCSA